MSFWNLREELSRLDRLRRSYYELLRDDLDGYVIKQALIRSYKQFIKQKISYPFVGKRELKPRARIPGIEYKCHNSFLLIFVEDVIPEVHKKYIRFFGLNKPTKTNLLKSKSLILPDNFDRSRRYIDSVSFYDFLKILLPIDYALLIQRDITNRLIDRYNLSHYHVRIDWPIAETAEDLGKNLRYISKDLYEKGDKYAEILQRKLFENYGMPSMIGGRRTAAIVAAQYLKRLACLSTIYVSSSESRALSRISENGVSKSVLIKLTDSDLRDIAEIHNILIKRIRQKYVVSRYKDENVCIFQVNYSYTTHARAPDDGKLREIKPDVHWLAVKEQYLIPKPEIKRYPPLHLNYIYS